MRRTLYRAIVMLALSSLACRTTRDMQKDYAETLRPAPLDAAPPSTDKPPRDSPKSTLRVRVWADGDYRGQTPRWEARIRDQFDRANALLESTLGTRLVVIEIKAWDRSGALTENGLAPALLQLEQADPAEDVDFSVGFVSSNQVFTASQEQLGFARLFGRHLLLRGMFSLAEYEGIRASLDKLTPEEAERLARERRFHREAGVLLHEVAHALGGFHEAWSRSLLAPAHDPKQAGFSPEATALLAVCIAHRRDKTGESRARFAAEYREKAAAVEPWDPADREHALAYLQVAGVHPPGAAPALRQLPQGASSNELIARSRALMERHQPPAPDEAVTFLLDAEQQLSAGPANAQSWLELAATFERAQVCSGAERAARRAGDLGESVLASCITLRRRVSLKAGERSVPERREHRYVAAFEQARQQLDRGRLDAAVALAEDLGRRFPGSPAPSVLTCFARTRQGSRGAAREACTQACAAVPEAFAPRYLLGLVEAAEQRWELARSHFERALALDDTPYDAWASLLALHEKTKDRSAAAALREKHLQRFGAPVSPVLLPAGIKLGER